jgi:mxaA protein
MPMRSRAISTRPECVGLLLAAALNAWAAEPQLGASADEPRAFGYRIGDRVERALTLDVPAGLRLDEATLPRPGGRGRAIELTSVEHHSAAMAGGTRHQLRLVYQIFLSPPELRTLELPPLKLHFSGQPREQDLRVDAWPVTVAPLAPVDASPRRGLGELRPDQPPPLIDTRPGRWRLAVYALLLALLLGYLAEVYLGLPWRARRRRPVARAWRQLRSLSPDAAASEWRAAFQRMHEALNETAGEVLFEQGVERFLAAQPRYAGLRDELLEFFRRSRSEFFAPGGAASVGDRAWLLTFCRRCRDVERGAA